MVSVRVLRFGEAALLAQVDSLADVLLLHSQLRATAPAGVVDLVPAARTVLVHIDPRRLSLAQARAWVLDAGLTHTNEPTASTLVTLNVHYDGEDLADVAAQVGVSTEALIARHSASEWTVAFTGFAPGFGYLVSADWNFAVPRRASPRTRVPAGSIALAAEFTGAYPRDTPGGWQLIGTTSAPLFNPGSSTPALLTPGTRVRFVAVGPRATLPAVAVGRGATAPVTNPVLTISESGLLSTVQDLGRPGRACEGIARSGAADRNAHRTANRLVGNKESAATIEVTMGGLRAFAARDVWFAVAGAWGPLSLAGKEIDPFTATLWPAGQELSIGWFEHGARAYLAVRGGLGVRLVADSRATDTMSGLGSAALCIGDTLAGGSDIAGPVPPDGLHPWGAPSDELIELDLSPGPRADWFAPSANVLLFEAEWRVSNSADRIGIRLDGAALERTRQDELPSEGMLPGAIQVPPNGQPVILGPDGPVTGGYPVIAVVTDASLDRLAQARPGTRIRFRHAR